MRECDRCGDKVDYTEPIKFDDDFGDHELWEICIECINEIANGEPIQAYDYDIFCHRMAQLYIEDPVNNSHLWRYAM